MDFWNNPELIKPTNVLFVIKMNLLKTQLFPHQERFLEIAKGWESDGHGGILAAEMGTGKTLMILSLLATESPKKTIVVAPLSLVNNWKNESVKHTTLNGASVVIYHGNKRHLSIGKETLLIITTYGMVRQDWKRWGETSPLYRFGAERVVLDEGHEIKNGDTNSAVACGMLPSRIRWVLTGTPIHNKASDFTSIVHFVDGSLDIGKFTEWRDQYYITFSKQEMAHKLPTRHNHRHIVMMHDNEAIIYNGLMDEAKELLDNYFQNRIKFNILLTKLLRLRQMCNHPYAPLQPEQWSSLEDRSSSKFQKIHEIIANIPSNEKIIVFSQFTTTLKLLERELSKQMSGSDSILFYTGKLSREEKQNVLTRFAQHGKVLLMSLKAGGVGLNIVEANHVIIADPWWNVAIEEQAIARVHRIGQTKEVHVHHLAVKGSIELWIQDLQMRKQNITAKTLGMSTRYEEAGFTIADLRRLFSDGR